MALGFRRHQMRFAGTLALLAAMVATAGAHGADASAPGLVDGGFEAGLSKEDGSGWFLPSALREAGYAFEVVDDGGAREGKRCAKLTAPAEAAPGRFGNVMQVVDAAPYRGRRVRFRASVRLEGADAESRAQLWLRVDREPDGDRPRMGAFDNMAERPIVAREWGEHDIVVDVADDARSLACGLILAGTGTAWLDGASLEAVERAGKGTIAPTAVVAATGSPADPHDTPPQPFWNGWLWLAATALVLFGTAHGPEGAARRFGLRFSCAYWGLCFGPRVLAALVPVLGPLVAMRWRLVEEPVLALAAGRVLGIALPAAVPTGSGDTTRDFVRLFVVFCAALVVAAIWWLVSTVRSRGGERPFAGDAVTADRLRVFLRYALATYLLSYGLAKVVVHQNQFAAPGVDQLLKPYGESSPMNLAWTFMGASRPYTVFAGAGELVGAALLLWRRTALAGALVSAGVMTNVVMLNFCYDIPVKQFSSHLLAASVFVAMYDARRLAALFVRNVAAEPADLSPGGLFAKRPRATLALKLFVLGWGFVLPAYTTLVRDLTTSVTIPFLIEGVFEVESYSSGTGGAEGGGRWKRVSIQKTSDRGPDGADCVVVVLTENGNRIGVLCDVEYASSGERSRGAITPRNAWGGLPKQLRYRLERTEAVRMTLEGGSVVEGMRAELWRIEPEEFLLMRRGFHWVNEMPFQR